jgi:hypothetical protein
LVKVKDDQVSPYVKMTLKVPRGLLEFLEATRRLGGDEPKEYLEQNVLAKELDCLIGSLPIDIFDVNFVRTRYGEGSDISNPKEISDDP